MSEEDHQSFVATLESFRELKSGISGSRIKKLTTNALEHVEDEEKIISLIINYSKTCSDSHKLGSLYIIDSIGRAYLDEARANDENINSTATPGTCAHAVYTLGESIQELLTSAISKSNEDHREKIRTLIDIWDRAGLFQKGYLNAIRAKCFSMDVVTNEGQCATSAGTTNHLAEDPKERCIQILNDLKPLKFFPSVTLPPALSSPDVAQQQAGLLQALATIQQQFSQQQQQVKLQRQYGETSMRNGHVTTEYGSRRERERERERYSSRRNRSRSPPRRDSHQRSIASGPHTNSNGPLGTNNHHLYPDEQNVPSNPHFRPKPVSYEANLPPEHIKVFSRTLFVGGVPMNMKEWDIANVLRPFAEVQSVILNNARKHAFVKVYSRSEAENVLLNFNKDGSSPLRTRWGVGFGPRDCCDYQHGFSIIPLHRLTDADKKWCVHAQWGGTGGQPLQGGVVFEEPDIIVGEGVSSKAISQKMPTDSGRNGPRSGKSTKTTTGTPPMASYATNQVPSPGQMYAQIQQPYPSQPAPSAYVQPQVPAPITTYAQQPAQQQSFDPTAQLNSLMSMLNQQRN
ncbi:hypothetical protein HG537_0B01280 [Torulaspora globosa]|uniref:Protein NRD1 n=1 Tax=Torulaspora globosa TaxID=48254 RepID=A0A7H9HNF1_9SACH|nr:hypothetical protein HG537_0B01280 [Torulaspora sp. CBS 2947]